MGTTRDSPSRWHEPAPEFELLYEKYRLPVYRVIRGIVLNADAAEQLTQQAFERAYGSRHRDASSSPSWLYRSAVETALAYSRRRRWRVFPLIRRLRSGDSAPRLPHPSTPAERALLTLSPRLRAVVLLSLYLGLSKEDVAAALQISPATVANQLVLATHAMRGSLSATDHREERERLKG